MISLLKRLFEDLHAIRLFLTSGPITIQLNEKDREALVEAATKFRRNGPRVKKETVNAD